MELTNEKIEAILKRIPFSRRYELAHLGRTMTEWTTKTDATELMWGTSGRGNPNAGRILHGFADLGLLERKEKGKRIVLFRAPAALIKWAADKPELGANLPE